MAKKKFTFWLDESVADRVRKRAIAEGRTLSEAGAAIVETGLSSAIVDRTIPSPTLDLSELERMLDRKFMALKNVPVVEPKPVPVQVQKVVRGSGRYDAYTIEALSINHQFLIEISKKIGGDHETRMRKTESFFERVSQKYADRNVDSPFDEMVFLLMSKSFSLVVSLSNEVNKNDLQNHSRSMDKAKALFRENIQKLGLPEEE